MNNISCGKEKSSYIRFTYWMILALILTVIFLMIYSGSIFAPKNILYRHERSGVLNEGWYIKNSQGYTGVTMGTTIKTDADEITVYRIVDDWYEGLSVYFSNLRHSMSVNVDGNQLFSVNQGRTSQFLMVKGKYIVDLPAKNGRYKLSFTFDVKDGECQLPEIFLGDHATLVKQILYWEKYTVIGLCVLFCIFWTLVVGMLLRGRLGFKDHKMWALYAVIALYFLWVLSDSPIGNIMGMEANIQGFLSYIGCILLPVPTLYFMWAYLDRKDVFIQNMLNLYLCCVLLQLLACIIIKVPLNKTLIVDHIAILITVGGAYLYTVYMSKKTRHENMTKLSRDCAVVMVFVIISVVLFWLKSSYAYRGIMLLAFIAFTFALFLNEIYRNKKALDDRIEEIRENEKNINIIKSFSSIYFGYFYILLKEKKYSILQMSEDYSKVFVKRDNLEETLQHNLELSTEGEFIRKMLEFCDLDTLDERMQDVDYISQEYKNTINGWCRAYFFVVGRDGEGHIKDVVFAITEIDEQKRKELETQEALELAYEVTLKANAAKTEFLSRMSHDIRTPLNAIIGMTEIAMMNKEDHTRVEECVQKIAGSGQILLSLINEVLDMSRIDAGKMELHEQVTDIEKLSQASVNILMDDANLHKHELSFSSRTIHKNVLCDNGYLQRVFLNIIGNSIKYTPNGGHIEVKLEEKGYKEGIAWYEFSFSDDGIGMSKEFSKTIFEPFSRENERTKNIGGTGLGMAIVAGIVRMMNGEISVESEPDKGSTFIITLPLRIVNEVIKSEPEKGEIEQKDYSGIRALVVDDQEMNREIAKEFLKMINVTVELAEDGMQAVEFIGRAKQGYYDVVFMDVQMPVMDGYLATCAIRSLEREDVKCMPIIAMTANAFSEDINRSLNAGMNDHISKPISIDILKKTLNKWVNK